MQIKKLVKINERYYSKAYRFFKGSKLKFMFIYTQAINGKKWCDDNKKARNLAFLKSTEKEYKVKAMVLGKHKLSLVVMN